MKNQKFYIKIFVAPVTKFSTNIAFACQRHYVEVMIIKQDLNNVKIITSTNMTTNKAVNVIVLDNASFLNNNLDLEVNEINRTFPNIYWTSKLHKNTAK